MSDGLLTNPSLKRADEVIDNPSSGTRLLTGCAPEGAVPQLGHKIRVLPTDLPLISPRQARRRPRLGAPAYPAMTTSGLGSILAMAAQIFATSRSSTASSGNGASA